MKTDFLDAFFRHWEDAELLFLKQRWANASHLHGMAAECGLKKLMLYNGMPYDAVNDKPGEKEDRKHINEIWSRYSVYQNGPLGRSYALPMCDPFSDWRVEQRYCHQADFTESLATGHRDGAMDVKRLIDKAHHEGLL